MAFQNGGYNNNAPQNGEKKKTNFRVGRIYGSDGTLDVNVWNSDKGGCYCVMNIKAAVGKDPSTGANVYEQKMSSELPSVFMNMDLMRAFLEGVADANIDTLNMTLDTHRGSKVTFVGSPANVKLTIDNQKTGTRTITIDAIPVGSRNIHASFKNLIDMVNICFTKAIRNKLDPDEFSMVVSDGEGNPEDSPF